MSTSASPKRKRRLRFSLRALLVFTTLFMLWGGYHTNRSWKERAAVQVLTRDQFGVNYGPPKPQPGFFSQTKYAYQKVVQRVWGEPFVTSVSLKAPLEPDVVEALCVLPYVQGIALGPPEFTDEEGTRQVTERKFTPRFSTPAGAIPRILRANPQLRSFRCGAWKLSDDDCRSMGNHQALEEIVINLGHCSESGFAQIVQAPRLQRLHFTYSNVTGSELASIPGSPTLVWIGCDYSPVGPQFAAFAARCPNLTILRANCPSIDDTFVSELKAHPSLTDLSLIDSKTTPESLDTLASIPNLNTPQIPRSMISPEAMDRLRQLRPRLKVSPY